MKKIWIIGLSVGVAIGLSFALRRASYLKAHAALHSETLRPQIESFFPEDHFIKIDPVSREVVPGPLVFDSAFLSKEPNSKELCWTFSFASWHETVVVYISLFGNPVSIGRIKYIDEPNKAIEGTSL